MAVLGYTDNTLPNFAASFTKQYLVNYTFNRLKINELH